MSLFIKLLQTLCFFVFFVMFSLVVIKPVFCLNEYVVDKEKRVCFEFRDQSMAEVAGLISDQLNYRVLMDDELAAMTISGKFTNVTLDEFFSRSIFRGKNVAILFDDNEQMVIIRSLGKKNKLTEYDRTSTNGLDAGVAEYDPLDMEVQPGVMRRDVASYINEIDPMEQEVQPGVKRKEVVPYVSQIDHMDLEVQPGVKRRDIVSHPAPVDPDELEVQPGIKRVDVAKVTIDIDPLDMEVQPNITRRDILEYNIH